MKKIIIIITVLFCSISTMAYLYFTGLNAEQQSNDNSLYAASANSPLIFSFENDKSVVDLLTSQELLQDIIGLEKSTQIASLKAQLIGSSGINKFLDHQNVYISLHSGANKTFDYLYCTQINPEFTVDQLLNGLNSQKLKISSEGNLIQIQLPDSTTFYMGHRDNLLLLSTVPKLVTTALNVPPNKADRFAQFIKANARIAKNSLAEVYINFQKLPTVLQTALPGKLTGELSPLSNQNTYAALVYNFSKEKLLLTGLTTVNNQQSYYQLFAKTSPLKVTINNVLPENTANYTIYTIGNYGDFLNLLKKWFQARNESKEVSRLISNANAKYHIDLEQVFPKYFKDQIITFQTEKGEKAGAINLSNGDKLNQLLIELSTPYKEDISLLNADNLLYCFYGEALSEFKRPYFTILDNYMFFSNSAAALKNIVNNYVNNQLFINIPRYSNTLNQLPGNSNIHYYIDLNNSAQLVQRNVYLPFYRHIYSADGLKNYSAITYQLSSDNGKFITNLLVTKKSVPQVSESIRLSADSLLNVP